MSIFKETFKPNIDAQLKKRQEVINNRTSENLQYMNSRNAWIRMSSAVNIYSNTAPNPPTEDDLKNEGNYDNTLAKQYILLGGTLNENGTLKSGIGSDFQYAYSNKSPEGNKYRLGIRPMPGITGIDIKSKGAYGSLREVTVNFQCWDIRQLEDLELLYMRPGYTVLVEWGWAPYFDENEKYTSRVDFYDIVNTTKSKETIWKEVDEKMSKNGNYEAMFGYVKNYSWTARMDGGYDCQTSIISFGEVIESLKVNYTPSIAMNTIKESGYLLPTVKSEKEVTVDNLDKEKLEKAYNKNILAGIFYELYKIAYKQFENWFSNTSDEGESSILEFTPKTGVSFKGYMFHKTIDITGDNKLKDEIGDGDEQIYISLETLCNILNYYVILRDQKNNTTYTELSVYEKEYSGSLDYKSGNGYLKALAHPLQVSVDPTVCLIKNNLWADGINITAEIPEDAKNGTGKPAITFNHTFASGQAEVFVKTLIRNLLTSKYDDDTYSEKKIIQYIKDNIKGNAENVKEATRVFNELYGTYKIESPDKSSDWGLSNKSGINLIVGKTLREYASSTNTFKDLLNDNAGGDLYDTQISEALGGDDNLKISDSDPVRDEQLKLEKEQEKIKETVDTAKTSLKFIKNLPKPYFVNDDYHTELGIIGSIFINLNLLYNLSLDIQLESQDKKEKNDIALYDYIKNVLAKISTAIGNVNNFDLFVEPNGKTVRIIDINFTEDPEEMYKKAATINIHNTSSIVRSYKLESKIFPEQSTQVAIGAQVGGGALGTDTTTLVAYNRRILDRIIPVKDMPSSDLVTNTAKDKLSALIKNIEILYTYFADLKYNVAADSDFDTNKTGEYANALKDLITFFRSIVNSKTNNRAILPTVLSIDMDGLGGLIIGNVFKIPEEILPKGYKGGDVGVKLGYVITGLGHSVGNGDWVTKIDAQTIILDGAKDPNKESDFDYSNITIDLTAKKEEEIVKKETNKSSSDNTPPPSTGKGWPITSKDRAFAKKHNITIWPAVILPDGTQSVKSISPMSKVDRHWLHPNPAFLPSLTSVTVPLKAGSVTVKVQPEFATALDKSFAEVKRRGLQKYLFNCSGGFVVRNVTAGYSLSFHAWGFAIDINNGNEGWNYGDKWNIANQTVTEGKSKKTYNWGEKEKGFYEIVKIMKTNGIDWLGSTDPMHFSMFEVTKK